MPEPLGVWIGLNEHGGIPRPARVDVKPPPHWRLEAVVATERPRSTAVAPDGRTALFIQDRDTSDVWLIDLEERVPRRLTTGRDPQPYWEDTQPSFSPDGATVAYVDGGWVCTVAVAGGPPQRLVEAGTPVWIDNDRLVVSIERDRCDRLATVRLAEPWPQRLARRTRRARLPRRRARGDRFARRRDRCVRVRPAQRLQPLRDPRRRCRDGQSAGPHRVARDS